MRPTEAYLLPAIDEVDKTIEGLRKKRFPCDPIIDPMYSRITSITSSAYKRHGAILERAIILSLSQCPDLLVWGESNFIISQTAERIADLNEGGTTLKYGEGSRNIQIDIMVYNQITNTLGAYECKRGFGLHDAGKQRSMYRDLRCVRMLLESYGIQKGLSVKAAFAKVIFYYGKCSIERSSSITAEDLDEHFGISIKNSVELVNRYFQERINDLLNSLATQRE